MKEKIDNLETTTINEIEYVDKASVLEIIKRSSMQDVGFKAKTGTKTGFGGLKRVSKPTFTFGEQGLMRTYGKGTEPFTALGEGYGRAGSFVKWSKTASGGTKLTSGKFVPTYVRLTRADGQKTILALMATELVGVVEGATSGERTLTLPPEETP